MYRIQMYWLHQWLNIPDNLENVQRSSLEVTFLVQEKAYTVVRKMVEATPLPGLPQLMDLTTSENFHPPRAFKEGPPPRFQHTRLVISNQITQPSLARDSSWCT